VFASKEGIEGTIVTQYKSVLSPPSYMVSALGLRAPQMLIEEQVRHDLLQLVVLLEANAAR
jgi:hypothetical protein